MTTGATPGALGSNDQIGALVPCPLCGQNDGYTLHDGSTFRWWWVRCNACGSDLAECRSDNNTRLDAPKPERWLPAEAAWNEQGRHAESLRAALRELVACKDLKDRLRQLHEMGHGTDYDDYHRRQPLAWAAAREVLKRA